MRTKADLSTEHHHFTRDAAIYTLFMNTVSSAEGTVYISCMRRWRTVSAISSWISGLSRSFTYNTQKNFKLKEMKNDSSWLKIILLVV